MAHFSYGESSKPQSPQKARLMGELVKAQRSLSQKEEEMRKLLERIQRLEANQESMVRERRREPRRHRRHHMHYGSYEDEDQDWRGHNFEERRHQHQHQPKNSFSFVKLPSFSGKSDPNAYLGWEAKVEQIFKVYEVEEDQKVRLASLEFVDYARQWWHQTLMDIGLNKRSVVIS